MKKTITLLTIFILNANTALFAQEADPSGAGPTPAASVIVSPAAKDPDPAALSSASAQNQYQTAAASNHSGRKTSWQNWVFAGTALVLTAVGIIAVTVNSGQNSPDH